MENLKTKRMNSTNIKEKSWKQYERNIRRLTEGITGKEYKNTEFLFGVFAVDEWINENSSSEAMKRMFYSVILIMLAPDKKDTEAQNGELYKHYQGRLSDLSQAYNTLKMTQQKSVKQNENWVSWKDILSLQKTMEKELFKLTKNGVLTEIVSITNKKGKSKMRKVAKEINRKQRTIIQDTLILSLYTLIKPRRLDYADMKIISIKNYNSMGSDKEQHNFLVITGKNKKFFSFGKQAQKNQNTDRNGVRQATFILPVPAKLNKILNMYLLFHPEEVVKKNFITRPFLYNTRGKPITGDGLSKAMIKIMKAKFNKNISPTLMRTIYLSDKHQNDVSVEEKKATAEEMGHTTGTAATFYTLKNK